MRNSAKSISAVKKPPISSVTPKKLSTTTTTPSGFKAGFKLQKTLSSWPQTYDDCKKLFEKYSHGQRRFSYQFLKTMTESEEIFSGIMPEVLRKACKYGDTSNDGFIDRKEFPYFLRNLRYFFDLHKAYQRMDLDKDKRLKKSEFIETRTVIDPKLTEKEAEKMFYEMDADGGGTVNYEEFCTWALAQPTIFHYNNKEYFADSPMEEGNKNNTSFFSDASKSVIHLEESRLGTEDNFFEEVKDEEDISPRKDSNNDVERKESVYDGESMTNDSPDHKDFDVMIKNDDMRMQLLKEIEIKNSEIMILKGRLLENEGKYNVSNKVIESANIRISELEEIEKSLKAVIEEKNQAIKVVNKAKAGNDIELLKLQEELEGRIEGEKTLKKEIEDLFKKIADFEGIIKENKGNEEKMIGEISQLNGNKQELEKANIQIEAKNQELIRKLEDQKQQFELNGSQLEKNLLEKISQFENQLKLCELKNSEQEIYTINLEKKHREELEALKVDFDDLHRKELESLKNEYERILQGFKEQKEIKIQNTERRLSKVIEDYENNQKVKSQDYESLKGEHDKIVQKYGARLRELNNEKSLMKEESEKTIENHLIEIKALQIKIETMRQENLNIEEIKNLQVKELENLKEAQKDFEQTIANNKSECEKTLENLLSEIKDLKSKIDALQEDNQNIEKNINLKEKEVESLTIAQRDNEKIIENHVSEIKSLKSQIQAMKEENEKTNENHVYEITTLQKQIEVLSQNNHNIKEENQKNNEKIDEILNENKKYKENIDTYLSEIQSLKSDFELLKSEKENLKIENINISKKIDEFAEENKNLKEKQLESLTGAQRDYEKTIDNHLSEIKTLKAEILTIKEENQKLKETHEEILKEKNSLIEQFEKKMIEKEKIIENHLHVIQSLNEELEMLKVEINDLKKDIQSKIEKINEKIEENLKMKGKYEEIINDHEKNIETLNFNVIALKTDIQSQAENINEKLNENQIMKEKHEEIIRDHKNIIESLKTDIEALKGEIQSKNDKINEKTGENDKMKENYEEIIRNLQNNIDSLKTNIEVVNTELQSKKDEIDVKSEEIEKLKEIIRNNEKLINEEENQGLKEKHEIMNKNQKMIDNLKAEINRLEETNIKYKEENERNITKINELSNENKLINDNHEASQEQLNVLNEENEKLKQENENIKCSLIFKQNLEEKIEEMRNLYECTIKSHTIEKNYLESQINSTLETSEGKSKEFIDKLKKDYENIVESHVSEKESLKLQIEALGLEINTYKKEIQKTKEITQNDEITKQNQEGIISVIRRNYEASLLQIEEMKSQNLSLLHEVETYKLEKQNLLLENQLLKQNHAEKSLASKNETNAELFKNKQEELLNTFKDEYEKNMKNQLSEISFLKTQIQCIRSENEFFNNENQKLQQRISYLFADGRKFDIQTTDRKASTTSIESEHIKIDLNSTKNECESLKSEVLSLKTELESLKTEVKKSREGEAYLKSQNQMIRQKQEELLLTVRRDYEIIIDNHLMDISNLKSQINILKSQLSAKLLSSASAENLIPEERCLKCQRSKTMVCILRWKINAISEILEKEINNLKTQKITVLNLMTIVDEKETLIKILQETTIKQEKELRESQKMLLVHKEKIRSNAEILKKIKEKELMTISEVKSPNELRYSETNDNDKLLEKKSAGLECNSPDRLSVRKDGEFSPDIRLSETKGGDYNPDLSPRLSETKGAEHSPEDNFSPNLGPSLRPSESKQLEKFDKLKLAGRGYEETMKMVNETKQIKSEMEEKTAELNKKEIQIKDLLEKLNKTKTKDGDNKCVVCRIF